MYKKVSKATLFLLLSLNVGCGNNTPNGSTGKVRALNTTRTVGAAINPNAGLQVGQKPIELTAEAREKIGQFYGQQADAFKKVGDRLKTQIVMDRTEFVTFRDSVTALIEEFKVQFEPINNYYSEVKKPTRKAAKIFEELRAAYDLFNDQSGKLLALIEECIEMPTKAKTLRSSMYIIYREMGATVAKKNDILERLFIQDKKLRDYIQVTLVEQANPIELLTGEVFGGVNRLIKISKSRRFTFFKARALAAQAKNLYALLNTEDIALSTELEAVREYIADGVAIFVAKGNQMTRKQKIEKFELILADICKALNLEYKDIEVGDVEKLSNVELTERVKELANSTFLQIVAKRGHTGERRLLKPNLLAFFTSVRELCARNSSETLDARLTAVNKTVSEALKYYVANKGKALNKSNTLVKYFNEVTKKLGMGIELYVKSDVVAEVAPIGVETAVEKIGAEYEAFNTKYNECITEETKDVQTLRNEFGKEIDKLHGILVAISGEMEESLSDLKDFVERKYSKDRALSHGDRLFLQDCTRLIEYMATVCGADLEESDED